MTLCQATRKAPNPRYPFRCVLTEGHLGPHQALGVGGIVLKQWANPEKQDMRKGVDRVF